MVTLCKWMCLCACLIYSSLLAQVGSQSQAPQKIQQDSAQTSEAEEKPGEGLSRTQKAGDSSQNSENVSFKDNMPWVITGLALLFGVYQYIKRKTTTKEVKLAELEAVTEHKQKLQDAKARTAEQRYRDALKEELGSIKILGSHDIESVPVDLLDAFVSLDLSESVHGDGHAGAIKMQKPTADERHATPESVLKRAFKDYRLLLLIGEPGSGKTTLMKYYAMNCLGGQGYKKFGFKEPVLPLYLPLRDLEPKEGIPNSLPDNLANWASKHVLDISAKDFKNWLHERPTLVLLDGLDEISDLEQRRKVCQWIDDTCTGIKSARFVVTSRWTGYRKVDGVELGFNHWRADVRPFSPKQQMEFLTKWFRAVYQRNYGGDDTPSNQWREQQRKRADEKVKTIKKFLLDDKSKALRQLATVPMLLQIMAILWQQRDVLPDTRSNLYNASLNYLLDFRDKRRNLRPVLPADKARRVLSPVALWMQSELEKVEAPRSEIHAQMQPVLDTLHKQPSAEKFCKNLVNRAGLLAEYGKADYIFRHKSFREYLAGVQIEREENKEEWIRKLISHFGEDWWEEPMRFFIHETDDAVFDKFMELFFSSEVSEDLDQKGQNLLQTLVREAPQKKIYALAQRLTAAETSVKRTGYILECLKTIDTPEAHGAVLEFVSRLKDAEAEGHEENLSFAHEIVSRSDDKSMPRDLFVSLPDSFRNPNEGNAEYIRIPAGKFKYSATEKTETVPNVYFAKYPATNKRYRRFMDYLDNKPDDQSTILTPDLFAERLLEFSRTIQDYEQYLGVNPKNWPGKLRSQEDDNKRFNQDDQPVVGVSWFAARTYCFWLSCLHAVWNGDANLRQADSLANIFRLPTEVEWEWAAAGREPSVALREYPWPARHGEPNGELANYDSNVGATTPVGRYPQGGTPEGLMDMAGNVWEWMANLADTDEDARALRGGSWDLNSAYLRCSARVSSYPALRSNYVGFRVVRPQS